MVRSGLLALALVLVGSSVYAGPIRDFFRGRPQTQVQPCTTCAQGQCQTGICAQGCVNGQCSVAAGYTACPNGQCTLPTKQTVVSTDGVVWVKSSPWKK